MIEAGRQLRLLQKPPAERLILGQRRGQQLQRHPSPQAQILGEVNDAHPTTTEHRLDPIPEELATDRKLGFQHAPSKLDDIPPSSQRLENTFNRAANPLLTTR